MTKNPLHCETFEASDKVVKEHQHDTLDYYIPAATNPCVALDHCSS